MSFVRRLLLPWFALFLGLATCAHGTLESTDSAMTLQAARALWLRGDSGLQRCNGKLAIGLPKRHQPHTCRDQIRREGG